MIYVIDSKLLKLVSYKVFIMQVLISDTKIDILGKTYNMGVSLCGVLTCKY